VLASKPIFILDLSYVCFAPVVAAIAIRITTIARNPSVSSQTCDQFSDTCIYQLECSEAAVDTTEILMRVTGTDDGQQAQAYLEAQNF
jgi:hypothetical protein